MVASLRITSVKALTAFLASSFSCVVQVSQSDSNPLNIASIDSANNTIIDSNVV